MILLTNYRQIVQLIIFYLYLMLYVCAVRFNVMELKSFRILGTLWNRIKWGGTAQ